MPNLASKVPKDKHPAAEQLYTEVNWMGKRLIEMRHAIGDAPLVVTYLDTNGNERTKTNPALDAYNSLFSSFIKGAKALDDMLAESEPASNDAKLSLDQLMVRVNEHRVRKAQ